MANTFLGKLVGGDAELLRQSWEEFQRLPIDLECAAAKAPPAADRQRTIERPVTVSGNGTFAVKGTTTITFEPATQPGWWFDRCDEADELPIAVSIRNVWTTGTVVSNIVLRSGGPSNYVRLVEHIIALRLGLGIDNLNIRIDSGDPPIFDQGSLDLVTALDQAGRRELAAPIQRVTVREPVVIVGVHGDFVRLAPPAAGTRQLSIDCGVSFATAIGRQRIRFPVTEELIRQAAVARTNTPYSKVLYCRTVGKLFADVRNLGYNNANVLIAGKQEYKNEPRLLHNGKSLEAVWHRAALDLLAALALVDVGRFVGEVTSFKAGHRLDVALVKQLFLKDLLVPLN